MKTITDLAAALSEIERLRAERVGLISALKDLADEFVKVFPVYYYAEPWAHERNVPLKVARAAIDAAKSPWPIRQQATPCGECHLQPGERCDVCGAIDAAIRSDK